jgi:hypothetical protein
MYHSRPSQTANFGRDSLLPLASRTTSAAHKCPRADTSEKRSGAGEHDHASSEERRTQDCPEGRPPTTPRRPCAIGPAHHGTLAGAAGCYGLPVTHLECRLGLALAVIAFGCGERSSTGQAAIPALVPGASIGPVKLGMSRAEVDALGLEVRASPATDDNAEVKLVGPYRTVFAGDRVVSIEVALAQQALRIGEVRFDGAAKAAELRAALPLCADVQLAAGSEPVTHQGDSVIPCDGGTTLIKPEASCERRAANGACEAWDLARPGVALQLIAEPW